MTKQGIIDPTTVHRAKLPNGLTVLVRRDASAPVVAINTHVKAGYFDETDDMVGIAHVLEHMYFKGTERRGVGEISKETKAAGGYLNAGTIYDYTNYYAVLPSSGFERGLEVQADAYANSIIDAGELAKELEVIIQEARRKADNPAAVAVETLFEVMHDKHRIRRWRIGREAGLRTLDRDKLLRFYRNFYRPGNTILTIVGDVNVDRTMTKVMHLYGSLEDGEVQRTPGEEEPPPTGFRYRELKGDIAQAQLVMGWRTPHTLHDDTPALDLLGTVLGGGRASRFYRAVRERQLAASVFSANYTPTQLGVFQVHAEGPPETVADAARAIWHQLAEVRTGMLTQIEVERADRTIEARWLRRFETMEGQANYLAEWEALGDWQLGEEYINRVIGLDASDLIDVARTYLTEDTAATVIYRPESAAEVAKDGSAFRKLLEKGQVEPLPPRVATIAVERPPKSAPVFELEEAGVRVYRTTNGIPVLIRPRKGAPIVHMAVQVLGGTDRETSDYAGITTLLARTALKGTKRRTAVQIAQDSEMLGGMIGVHVGADNFGWSLNVPRAHTEHALELLGDVVQHAAIPPDAFEVERTVALADVAMLRDDMYRYPVRLAIQAAFKGHAYGIPSLGTEKSLQQLTASQVRDWHKACVCRGPLAIGLTGDVDPDEAAELVAREFPELKWSEQSQLPDPEWPEEVTTNAESREKAQTALIMGFPGPKRDDADRFVARVVTAVTSGLGGRFFDELRDKRSLAYTVHTFSSERRLAGAFFAYIATSPDREAEAREGLLAEFAKLRERPIEDEELERAKTYLLGAHAIRQQSGAALLADMLDAWLLGTGLAELEDYNDNIRNVTTRAIQGIAERYFNPERRVEGIVRGKGRCKKWCVVRGAWYVVRGAWYVVREKRQQKG